MLLIADNIQITKESIRSAMDALDPAPIRNLVRQCIAAGAHGIDINPGPLNRDPERKWPFWWRRCRR